MITAKFGGTAMTAQNFSHVKRLVGGNCGCVVVSAVGREFLGDDKTTDLLKAHFFGDERAWEKVEQKYKRLVRQNGVAVDVEKILYEARKRSKKFGLEYCMSLGEETSAKITAAFLERDYVEAEKCVVFKNGKLLLKETLRRIKDVFSNGVNGVIGGFYGGSDNGRCVFSRGGSDVTGSLCALATNSVLYENWTDVSGVCKANPVQICGAQTVANLSYGQMYFLAKGGAEVLHPDSVKYAELRAVPIKVGNFLNDRAESTLVCNCPSQEKFLGVTEKRVTKGVVTTVLHSMSGSESNRRLSNVFSKLEKRFDIDGKGLVNPKTVVYGCKLEENRLQICTTNSILKIVYDAFAQTETE